MTDRLYRPARKYNHEKRATRRQIMDWLIYHVPLSYGAYNYPFKILFWSALYIGNTDLHISYSGETPWQCYDYATTRIFADPALRESFLILYNNS